MKPLARRSALSRFALTGLLLSGLQLGSLTLALADTEPNNTFATRELIPSSTTVVNGTIGTAPLDFSVADFVFNDTISPGSIVSHTVNGRTPGGLFAVYVDNTATGLDTVLHTLDENGSEIDFNDDFGSPLGNALASGLSGLVNADGSVRFDVSAYPDIFFTGAHGETSSFDTYLKFVEGDVDFYTVTGLAPNSPFTAEITGGNVDTVMGLFDSTGTLLATDDDGGAGLFSLLTGNVGSDGTLNLAISAFADFGFNGRHFSSGDPYTLSLTVQAVPEPGTLAFALTAGISLLGLARKRRNK